MPEHRSKPFWNLCAFALLALSFASVATAHATTDHETDAAIQPHDDLMLSEAKLIAQAREAGISEAGIAELLAARHATAPFHSIDLARAAGWPDDLTGCLEFPEGYMHDPPGAMGHHYINLELFNDGGTLDPTRPEAVMYETQADGSLRLIAVEYVVPERDHPRTEAPPVLFGREMMFHPDFGVWAHHVWLWRYNPYGLFADVNPNVSCEFAERE